MSFLSIKNILEYQKFLAGIPFRVKAHDLTFLRKHEQKFDLFKTLTLIFI